MFLSMMVYNYICESAILYVLCIIKFIELALGGWYEKEHNFFFLYILFYHRMRMGVKMFGELVKGRGYGLKPCKFV